MGAKTARSQKTVLSRQEIATKRKSLQEKRLQTDHSGRRALVGVVILALSTLALFAVGSFDPRDRKGPGFHNAIGPVGHAIGDGLLSALGLCAFVIPAAGLYTAMVLFIGARSKSRWSQIVSGALLVLAGSVLAELLFAGKPGWSYPPGGALGVSLGGTLCGMFGTLGTVILVSAISCVALIVGTQFAFLKLCSLAWAGMRVVGERARQSAVAFWAEQKIQMERRREEAAAAKLEEQAFLAQLEADEEELNEAEREAAEAEAMAEEALRLSKEAEARELAKAQAQTQAKLARKGPRLAELPPPSAVSAPSLPSASLPEHSLPEHSLPSHSQPEFVSQPPRPGSDPAWAKHLLPALAAQPAAAPAPASPTEAPGNKKRERKTPQINLPPGSVGAAPVAESATEQSGALAEQLAAPPAQAPVVSALASTAAAPAAVVQAAPAVASAIVPAAASALARMPLIVEPKAPPKPTKKLDQEQFVFNGDRKSFTLPPLEVLELDKKERSAIDKDAFLATAEKLRAKLADFGIVGEVVEIRPGPVVTMYEFLPGPGIKVSKIASLSDDLAMAMEAMRVRIVAPIPGKGVVGIEVPNRDRETVFLKEIVEQDAFNKSQSRLTMAVGKDIEGMPYVFDLAKAPHLLIAGTTGSGKSVAVNSMIMSILLKATPEEVRFIMVDPKMLELSVYEGIPHLLLPVVTDPKKAALALRWAVEEMERRYHLLSEAGVRNISGYNKLVETAQGEAKAALAAKEADSKKGRSIRPAAEGVVEGKVTARSESAKLARDPGDAKKPAKPMLIVDVADGETEDDALARAQGPQMGVRSPNADREEMREPVEGELAEGAEAGAPIEAGASALPAGDDGADEALDAGLSAAADDAGNEGSGEGSGEGSEAGEEDAEKKELKKLPYIVVIIDELADLMMVASREVETYIARLAQMARAAGIHLMVATQRPSTDVVTGVIKANFPTRISFMLRSKPDSMTILGTIGAEALLGMGDMLIMPPTSAHLQRVHGAYVSENEIKKAVDHLKAQGKPVYDENILKPREEESEGGGEEDELSDELYDQALATVSQMENVSISMLQRKMRIGYNRAARMIERMERDGVVGPADGAKPRQVLIRAVGEMPGAGAA